jgi:hypothetical protein
MLLHLGERLTDKGTTSPEKALILWTAMYRMNIKTTLYTKKKKNGNLRLTLLKF